MARLFQIKSYCIYKTKEKTKILISLNYVASEVTFIFCRVDIIRFIDVNFDSFIQHHSSEDGMGLPWRSCLAHAPFVWHPCKRITLPSPTDNKMVNYLPCLLLCVTLHAQLVERIQNWFLGSNFIGFCRYSCCSVGTTFMPSRAILNKSYE